VPSSLDYSWLGGFSVLVAVSCCSDGRGERCLSVLLVLVTLASGLGGVIGVGELLLAPLWLTTILLAAIRPKAQIGRAAALPSAADSERSGA
jgi:hypothetical protein